jgi:hypothetical protein
MEGNGDGCRGSAVRWRGFRAAEGRSPIRAVWRCSRLLARGSCGRAGWISVGGRDGLISAYPQIILIIAVILGGLSPSARSGSKPYGRSRSRPTSAWPGPA